MSPGVAADTNADGRVPAGLLQPAVVQCDEDDKARITLGALTAAFVVTTEQQQQQV